MRHKVLPPSKELKQEKNQNHQSLILFPSSGRWYSRRGGTLTYTPPLSPSWGPPTTPEIELPQGATWRLTALLQQAPQGPFVHSSLSGNPCHCNLQPITFPRDSLICVDPEWTLCGCVVKFTLQGFFIFLPVCKKCKVWYPIDCHSIVEELKASVFVPKCSGLLMTSILQIHEHHDLSCFTCANSGQCFTASNSCLSPVVCH